MPDSPDPKRWAKQAQDLAQEAQALREAQLRPIGVCAQSQQAIEVAIKGVLIANGIKHPFTHDLTALHNSLPTEAKPNFGMKEEDLHLNLTHLSQSWLARYPRVESARDPDWSDADLALGLAKQFATWASQHCGAERKLTPEAKTTAARQRKGRAKTRGPAP